ncbi:MAG: hypothetical protein ACRDJV_08305 [Actinomycetota bacterium]
MQFSQLPHVASDLDVRDLSVPGPWAARGRREVIIERERPVERERVVERPATERVVERDRDVR